MSREQLHQLVDSLPEAQLPVAITFLSELGDEEVVDARGSRRARREHLTRRTPPAMWHVTGRVEFRPAGKRDLLARPCSAMQPPGHGFRLRVGKWVFFRQEQADLLLVTGIDNRGEAY